MNIKKLCSRSLPTALILFLFSLSIQAQIDLNPNVIPKKVTDIMVMSVSVTRPSNATGGMWLINYTVKNTGNTIINKNTIYAQGWAKENSFYPSNSPKIPFCGSMLNRTGTIEPGQIASGYYWCGAKDDLLSGSFLMALVVSLSTNNEIYTNNNQIVITVPAP